MTEGELNVAEWTGQAGDPCLARDLLTALLAVYVRVFGPDHAGTRKAEADLNRWADRCQSEPGASAVAVEPLNSRYPRPGG